MVTRYSQKARCHTSVRSVRVVALAVAATALREFRSPLAFSRKPLLPPDGVHFIRAVGGIHFLLSVLTASVHARARASMEDHVGRVADADQLRHKAMAPRISAITASTYRRKMRLNAKGRSACQSFRPGRSATRQGARESSCSRTWSAARSSPVASAAHLLRHENICSFRIRRLRLGL
jgi:hypothetical protein